MKIINCIINFIQSLFGNNKTTTTDVNTDENVVIVDSGFESDNTEQSNEQIQEPRKPQIQRYDNEFKKFHVLIDNGHGKNTSGKGSPYSLAGVKPELPYKEYAWAREIAVMIENELNKRGINCERIVPEETDITLAERVKRVNTRCTKYGAQNTILISIHSNAAGGGSKWMTGRGWSAYTSKGKTNGDVLCEYIYKEAEKNFAGMKIRKDKSDGDSDMEENFYILKNTKCPAVLSENFFHDNIEDVEFITSDIGKAAVVKTHVDGIIEYFKGKV